MRAYDCQVLQAILLYNSATDGGVTDCVINKLEVSHRRHLREVLGARRREIKNVELYKRCDATPLCRQIMFARWSLFGHVLRLGRDTPAQLAMDYYGTLLDGEAEPRGRPDSTLPVLLFNEYKKYWEAKRERGWSVKKSKTQILAELRELATKDRLGTNQKWREVVIGVCDSNGS